LLKTGTELFDKEGDYNREFDVGWPTLTMAARRRR
jgi:hypothetical protein